MTLAQGTFRRKVEDHVTLMLAHMINFWLDPRLARLVRLMPHGMQFPENRLLQKLKIRNLAADLLGKSCDPLRHFPGCCLTGLTESLANLCHCIIFPKDQSLIASVFLISYQRSSSSIAHLHPTVVYRPMPKPCGSYGSMATGSA